MNDDYIEYKELADGTPEQMAREYCDILNAALAENRTGISKRYAELMSVVMQSDWIAEFKGRHYVYMRWSTTRSIPKEQFFDGADPWGNKEV